MRKLWTLLFITFFCLPQNILGAGISISEIMYDTEGSDGGREWIEIYNNSGSAVDLTSYKFFENGVSHSISHLEGQELLQNNSYAIIADNANNFISEYNGASKSQIYDASFSLSNSAGEYLALKDSEGGIVNETTYDVSIGGGGDGNSLQRDNSGSWVASLPTVLFGPVESNNNKNNPQNNIVENTNTNTGGSSSGAATKKESVMHFEFNTPKTVIVGNDNIFKATLYGSSGEIINYGEFVWNFGDGTIETVKNLNEINHIYFYPGDYTISITYKYAWNPKPILVGRVNVLVVDSPFELTKFYSSPKYAVGITNKRDTEYDISGYIIKTSNRNINLPEATFIGGKDEIVFVLPQGEYDQNSISLLNPLGTNISSFPVAELEIENLPVIKNNLETASVPYVDYSQDLNNFGVPENINTPKVIELQASAGSVKTNSNAPFVFIGMILLASGCIFYIRNNRKNNESVDPDDYTLQDE